MLSTLATASTRICVLRLPEPCGTTCSPVWATDQATRLPSGMRRPVSRSAVVGLSGAPERAERAMPKISSDVVIPARNSIANDTIRPRPRGGAPLGSVFHLTSWTSQRLGASSRLACDERPKRESGAGSPATHLQATAPRPPGESVAVAGAGHDSPWSGQDSLDRSHGRVRESPAEGRPLDRAPPRTRRRRPPPREGGVARSASALASRKSRQRRRRAEPAARPQKESMATPLPGTADVVAFN